MGKWATYQRRGGGSVVGSIAPPSPAPAGFTAVPGGVGVITVARVEATPAGSSGGAQQGMFFRALDTTTQLFTVNGASSVTGLVSGRAYRVSAAWFGANGQMSDYSAPITVNAG